MNEDLLLKRFLAKVDKQVDGCWIWTATKDLNGYGIIKANGKSTKAHRVAYQLFKGPIPEELEVRHSCHNRACASPDHLSLGTRAENMRDKMEAGRHKQGKLDSELHSEVMRRSWAGMTPEQREQRVKRVSQALKGKAFTEEHLTNLRASSANQPGRAARSVGGVFSPDDVLDIRHRYSIGEHQDAIAKHYGVCRAAIANIVRGRTYQWVAAGPVKRTVGYGTGISDKEHPHANTGKTRTDEQKKRHSEFMRTRGHP